MYNPEKLSLEADPQFGSCILMNSRVEPTFSWLNLQADSYFGGAMLNADARLDEF